MAAKLKVFGWSDGFHSWTVATSSRPKALAAWEVGQDLFKTGLAHEVHDGPERDAALASPGTVIKTGLAIDPGVMAAVKPKAASRTRAEEARRRKAEARVADLQSRLDALQERSATERADLETRQAALAQEIDDVTARDDKARKGLQAQLREAQRAV